MTELLDGIGSHEVMLVPEAEICSQTVVKTDQMTAGRVEIAVFFFFFFFFFFFAK
jgi:hypothetical protein